MMKVKDMIKILESFDGEANVTLSLGKGFIQMLGDNDVVLFTLLPEDFKRESNGDLFITVAPNSLKSIEK